MEYCPNCRKYVNVTKILDFIDDNGDYYYQYNCEQCRLFIRVEKSKTKIYGLFESVENE